MKLIIVSGPSASGKTTVGREIAHRLDYEFLSKDDIKERLFDSSSRTTHDYFWYEARARKQFFEQIEAAIRQNTSIVIESDFTPNDRKKLRKLKNSKVCIVEIYCTAKGFTRLKRYIKRTENGSRHRGHHDRRWYGLMFLLTAASYSGVKWPFGPTKFSDVRLDIDTSDTSKVDYAIIEAFVRKA